MHVFWDAVNQSVVGSFEGYQIFYSPAGNSSHESTMLVCYNKTDVIVTGLTRDANYSVQIAIFSNISGLRSEVVFPVNRLYGEWIAIPNSY